LILGNIGIVAQFDSRVDEALDAFGRALLVARSGGMPDMWGRAALNLGVLSQKCGDYDRARELFAEALALLAAVKHSEGQLVALFNMGHVERELGQWESAAELYEATIPLAQRIGQADIEIGAVAGAGLCALELGNLEGARGATAQLDARIGERPDWFQGREIVEALMVRLLAIDGRLIEGFSRFTSALALAETSDLYSAAWLTAVCAEALVEFDHDLVRSSVTRYRDRVRELGYVDMTRRYDLLAQR
jgi:tetratricopeptide (TPR) repeat protein